jgi:hypothetical protein
MSATCFSGAARDSPRAPQVGNEEKTISVEFWCKEHQWPSTLFVLENRVELTLIKNLCPRDDIAQNGSSDIPEEVEPMPWQANSPLAVLDVKVASSQPTQDYQRLLLTSLRMNQESQSSLSDYSCLIEPDSFDLHVAVTILYSQVKKLIFDVEALQAQYQRHYFDISFLP